MEFKSKVNKLTKIISPGLNSYENLTASSISKSEYLELLTLLSYYLMRDSIRYRDFFFNIS